MAIFFLIDTATTEIYTLSLHDALPISCEQAQVAHISKLGVAYCDPALEACQPLFLVRIVGFLDFFVEQFVEDRKSTRLNSSHRCISYAVFCLKKKTGYD